MEFTTCVSDMSNKLRARQGELKLHSIQPAPTVFSTGQCDRREKIERKTSRNRWNRKGPFANPPIVRPWSNIILWNRDMFPQNKSHDSQGQLRLARRNNHTAWNYALYGNIMKYLFLTALLPKEYPGKSFLNGSSNRKRIYRQFRRKLKEQKSKQ